VIVVVASVDTPFTESVPCEVSDEVAVTTPPVNVPAVIVWKKELRAVRMLEKKLLLVALVVEAFVAKRLVDVELEAVRLTMVPDAAVRSVIDVVEEMSLAIVPDAEVRSLIVPLVIVVVASVDTPFTESVPCEVSDEVAVTTPPVNVPAVSVWKKAVIPLRMLAKKLDDVALVVLLLIEKKLVVVALVVLLFVAKRLVAVAFVVVLFCAVRPVKLPFVALKLTV
jgi:hypothetical protein